VSTRRAALVRVFAGGNGRKNDDIDVHSVALVGLHSRDLREVRRDDHSAALRLLANRRKELVDLRTQCVNRLHRDLVGLISGGTPQALTAVKAKALLASIRPRDEMGRLRRRLAADQLADLVALDKKLGAVEAEIRAMVKRTPTGLPDIYGIGPIAGLRHCGLRAVRIEDHTAVIRMLIDRYDDLVALRTQAACRLHVALRELIAGGAPRRLGATRATRLLRNIHPQGAAGLERKRLAVEVLADFRRLDRDIATAKRRVSDAVTASGTSLLELHGVGPIVAGFILGHVGDPARFPTPERFASYNGTAPIEASSGPRKRHRLNPRGNRKLNHALHLAAVTQVRHDTPGRAYYQRKITEGKSKKESLRALKRRISDAVWRQLQVDLGRR